MEKSDQAFDQLLRSALENLEPAGKPDWQHMQSQLEESYQDQAFDQQIRSILEKTHADAKELNWHQFEQKMLLQAERRRRIITARMVELVLVLLVFRTIDHLGFTNYLPVIPNSIAPTPAPTGVPLAGTPKAFLTDLTPLTGASLPMVAANAPVRAGGILTADDAVGTDLQPSGKTALHLQSLSIKTGMGEHVSHEWVIQTPARDPINTLAKEFRGLLPGLRKAEELKLPNGLSPLPSEQGPGTSLPLPRLEGSGRIAVHRNSRGHLVSIFSGLMVNGVESPAFIDPGKHYRQAHAGVQSGIRVEFLHEDWILRSGLSYQNLRYHPNLSETLGNFDGGYYKIRFREIQSQLISIPVGIERVLHSGASSRLSAGFGLSITASLDNRYALDTITDLSGPSRQGISFDPSTPSELLARVSKSSHRGLLQGGNFGSNAFASLILSVTYHRDLGNGWTVYSSLEGSKMLGEQGFGPNADKLFHAGWSAGVGRRF